MMTAANPLVEKEEAKKIVDRFVRRFDRSYRLLVYYAAIPLIVTPELLNYLRHQFLRGQVSWVAEVDLLLSDLFEPVGYELYAMDTAVRAYLLENIENFFQQQRRDEKHLQEVALVLLGYVKYLARTNSFFRDPELQSQQWAAMVCLEDKKEQVSQEIKEALQHCVSEAELARLTQITQELSPQLSSYPSLIQFAELVRDLLLDLKPGLTEINKQTIAQVSQDLEIDLSKFSQLGIVELLEWEFETPTVDRRGETLKTTTYTASYFTETLTDKVQLEMVAIPGGTFTMGSPKDEKGSSDRERPQHEVKISPFFIGKYPVTQSQWRAIASRTDLKQEIDLDPDPSEFKGEDRPVEQVNWYEAVEFCQRLSKLRERNYRLPSEAQWEYACRAGTTTPFHFGETLTANLANYYASTTYQEEPSGEYRRKTTPVGQFPPNAFGLYDMHGNVWEWCEDDWHDNYERAPTDGKAWLELSNNNISKVLRGSSWHGKPNFSRSASRGNNDSDFSNDLIGFRVAVGSCLDGDNRALARSV